MALVTYQKSSEPTWLWDDNEKDHYYHNEPEGCYVYYRGKRVSDGRITRPTASPQGVFQVQATPTVFNPQQQFSNLFRAMISDSNTRSGNTYFVDCSTHNYYYAPAQQSQIMYNAGSIPQYNGQIQTQLRSRKHYGVVGRKVWEAGDPPALYKKDRNTGKAYCENSIEWLVAKGSTSGQQTCALPLRAVRILEWDHQKSTYAHTVYIVSCSLDSRPMYYSNTGFDTVTSLPMEFTFKDLKDATPGGSKTTAEGTAWFPQYSIEVQPVQNNTYLHFKVILKNRRKVGEAYIAYEGG